MLGRFASDDLMYILDVGPFAIVFLSAFFGNPSPYTARSGGVLFSDLERRISFHNVYTSKSNYRWSKRICEFRKTRKIGDRATQICQADTHVALATDTNLTEIFQHLKLPNLHLDPPIQPVKAVAMASESSTEYSDSPISLQVLTIRAHRIQELLAAQPE